MAQGSWLQGSAIVCQIIGNIAKPTKERPRAQVVARDMDRYETTSEDYREAFPKCLRTFAFLTYVFRSSHL